MADKLATPKRTTGKVQKYAEQHKKLLEMGFDTASVNDALESTKGNLPAATAVLLGEPAPVASSPPAPKPMSPMKVVGKHSNQANKPASRPQDMREIHNKFMATYKVTKCREKANHDRRMCLNWHTKGDRRRNPFEIPYTCVECPNSVGESTCDTGDSCLKAHNMLERMFHPELFKISMCQKANCERGNFCAFAHSEEDHRIPASHEAAKMLLQPMFRYLELVLIASWKLFCQEKL